jgi:RHS repeat-associated protein
VHGWAPGQSGAPLLDCAYRYDYRTRRIERAENDAISNVIFSGGVSVQETGASEVKYIRGPDQGGGVGGLLYSIRPSGVRYNHFNARGDVLTQTDESGNVQWHGAYEANGTRRAETGSNPDRQRTNTKEEDPSGLINDGFRYRDPETNSYLTRDPAGFVDGPNLYCHVRQNPWSKFDPEGLKERVSKEGIVPAAKAHHKVPFSLWDRNNLPKKVQEAFNNDDALIGTPQSGVESHNFSGHGEYNRRVERELKKYIKERGHPGGLTAKQQKQWANAFVGKLDNTQDKYIKGFNGVVDQGRSAVKRWATTAGAKIVRSERSILKRIGRAGTALAENGKRVLKVIGIAATICKFADTAEAEGVGQAVNDTAEELINPIGLNSREMNELNGKAYSGFWDFLFEGVYDDDMKDELNTLPQN